MGFITANESKLRLASLASPPSYRTADKAILVQTQGKLRFYEFMTAKDMSCPDKGIL